MVKRLNIIALLLLFVGVFVIILANVNLFVLWRAPSLPVIWTLDLNSNVFTSPAIDSNGTLYVIDENKNLSAVSSNGKLKWRFTLDDLTRGEPIVAEDGTIYVYTSNGTLYSITNEGVLKWKLEKVVLPFSSLTLASDGNIYACCNVASDNEQEKPTITGFAKVTPDGKVEMLNQNISFQAIFERQDGKFYAVNQNGTVYLVSKSGEVLWEKSFTNSIFKIGFGFFSSPRGCVISNQGFIYSTSAEGILYAVSGDGRVYALKTNSKVSTNSTWYTKSANFRNARSVQNLMEK